MIRIVILGAGNVATQLFKVFFRSEKSSVVQVYNRSKARLNFFKEKTSTTNSLEDLAEADIYILALKDDAIAEIALKLAHLKALIVHTSGSVSISALDSCERNGVFYPLQTFSKNKKVDFHEIPICLETNNEKDFLLLKALAESISKKVYAISSEQRKTLHVSAVFVCNFVNHLYAIGAKLCEEHKMSFEMLQPLIMETAKKITELNPIEAQTGPALRQDQQTIESHLSFLKSKKQKEIYELLTHSIQELHGKKL